MKRSLWLITAMVLVLGVVVLAPASPVLAAAFPGIISLPDGFRPEGIDTGHGTTLYAGSLGTGAIYQADLRTGTGSLLVQPQPGRVAVGLDFDARTGYLYVAGGPTGHAYVYDTSTGATVRDYQLTTAPSTFINDEIVTRDAVYFTDSSQQVLYRIPLGGDGQPGAAAQTVPLTGDFKMVAGQINSNGIEATPNGKALIVVNTALGTLYRVDPATGEATLIDLHGGAVPNGDGLLLRGHTLYVVQNFLNRIAVVQLDHTFTSGTIESYLTNPNFDVPTTIANHGSSLYVVNARFSTPPTPSTTYTVVQVR